jgi:rfaE bifunctional protein nucleotidyltransferase chain/domain
MRNRGKRPFLTGKVRSISQLKRLLAKQRRAGKRIVFTNGCFDILHLGHVKYLEDAARSGDLLVVAVNSDASVRKIKGWPRPFVPVQDRMRVIAGLESVDFVCLFKEDTPFHTIRQLRPDILVKGADWKDKDIVGGEFVRSYGGRVLTIKFIQGRSTTALIKKIAHARRSV